MCRKDCQPAWRSLSAATDAIGAYRFNGGRYGLHVQRRARLSAPLHRTAEGLRIIHSSFFSLQDSFISVPRPFSELPGKAQKKLRSFDRSFMLALPIFPCSHPQSIVGANELNFCVRDGNRCTLTAINTNYLGTHPEN